MTNPFHIIPLTEGDSLTFYSKEDLCRWVQEEQQTWAWLWSGEQDGVTIQAADFQQINQLFVTSTTLGSRDDDVSQREFQSWMTSSLDGNQKRFVFRHTAQGRAILLAKERIGIGAARVMYRVIKQGIDWQQIRTTTDIKGVMLAADPTMVEQASIAGELQQERANYRGSITRLENRVRELEQVNRDVEARRIAKVRKVC